MSSEARKAHSKQPQLYMRLSSQYYNMAKHRQQHLANSGSETQVQHINVKTNVGEKVLKTSKTFKNLEKRLKT